MEDISYESGGASTLGRESTSGRHVVIGRHAAQEARGNQSGFDAGRVVGARCPGNDGRSTVRKCEVRLGGGLQCLLVSVASAGLALVGDATDREHRNGGQD